MYFIKKLEWVMNNVDQIREAFEQKYEAYWDNYFDLSSDDVITICRTCHFNWHENNQKPCRFCDETYGKERTDHDVIKKVEEKTGEKVTTEGAFLCWDHFAELKGLNECECGDRWYNPHYNDQCKSCRSW